MQEVQRLPVSSLHFFSHSGRIAGLLASSDLSPSQREFYTTIWNALQKQTHSGGNFYPPPWIQRRIRRGGMVYILARRLLDNCRAHCGRMSKQFLPFYHRILFRATDFSQFRGILWNLQAITRSHIRLPNMCAPNGCCWHDGLKRLLVTNNTQILAINIQQPDMCSIFFEEKYTALMGIDVAKDGTIVTISNSMNLAIFISQTGDFIAKYPVLSGNHPFLHELLHSSVIFTHDEEAILCLSNKFGIHALSATGQSLGTFGRKGAKPGEFREPTQIMRLPGNQYAVSDSQNGRVQIVEIKLSAGGTMVVHSIIGNNFFSIPTALVACGNCLVVMSNDDGHAYFCQGDKLVAKFGGVFEYARLACRLPNGSFAVVRRRNGFNSASSEVIILCEPEDWRMPPALGQCLDESLPL